MHIVIPKEQLALVQHFQKHKKWTIDFFTLKKDHDAVVAKV